MILIAGIHKYNVYIHGVYNCQHSVYKFVNCQHFHFYKRWVYLYGHLELTCE